MEHSYWWYRLKESSRQSWEQNIAESMENYFVFSVPGIPKGSSETRVNLIRRKLKQNLMKSSISFRFSSKLLSPFQSFV
jgi:hypothetical protein